MTSQSFITKFDRRTLIKGAAALGVFQAASPFIIQARGETPIRMGMVDPLTGVYAAPAGNEVMGAKLAVGQMNARGGILGRQVELLVEDSANDVGTGVQKARKLIERDQVNFMIGDVNSGMCSGSATPRGWKPIRSPTCFSKNTARNGISSRPTTPSVTRSLLPVPTI
jgi:branched-chain amino acid transport system substrate-binding protein